MDRKALFAGSILSADLLNLGSDIQRALDAKIDIIHFDVMDYHFVPNLTFGPGLLKAIHKKFPQAKLDVHLMVDPITDRIINDYLDAGAHMISFHPEACAHTDRYLSMIKERGAMAGLALNPGTSPECLRYLWDKLDFVLVMTVNPGFGGQKLIGATLQKVSDVRRMATQNDVKVLIEVDGGVAKDTVKACSLAGADIFVVGSAFFAQEDFNEALNVLHTALKAE